MYLEHFGLREAPFRITPHTDFFFAGANRGAVLEGLVYAVSAGEGLVKVTGEVGSGKTMLSRVLIERLPASVETIYLAVPSLSRDELLASIAGDLGIETRDLGIHQVMRALQEKLLGLHAEGRRVVALVDEAHAMPPAALEDMRLLSNLETGREKLMQIVLFGQPELDEHLALPQMRQLKERITHSFTLGPLTPREVRAYLDFRLRAAGYRGPDLFSEQALRVIIEASEGLSRRINIYADKTLLAAFAAGTHTVTAAHAEAAVADSRITLPARPTSRRALAFTAIAGVAGGIGLGFAAALFMADANRPADVRAPAKAVPTPRIVPASATAPLPSAAEEPLPAPPQAPVPETKADPVAETAVARDPVQAALESGREKLARPGNRYAVQLMATDARAREYVSGYLAEAERLLPSQALFLVPLASVDAPRLGVLYGDFPERSQAFAALRELPEPLKQFHPYVRAFDAIREESPSDPAR